MSFLSRFFGRNDKKEDTTATTLIANPNKSSNLISLQIVFKGNISIDEAQLEQVLRKLDPSMKQAFCQRDPQIDTFFGLAGWGKHVIQMVGFEVPFPKNIWRYVSHHHTIQQNRKSRSVITIAIYYFCMPAMMIMFKSSILH